MRTRLNDLIDGESSILVCSLNANGIGMSFDRIIDDLEIRQAARDPLRLLIADVECETTHLTRRREIPDDVLDESALLQRFENERLLSHRVRLVRLRIFSRVVDVFAQ